MLIYTVKRALLSLLIAFTVSAISFGLVFISGDPAAAIAGEGASDADILFVRHAYGFDRPVAVQYLDWIKKAVRGDFGQSYFFNLPVSEIIAEKLPKTLALGFCSLTFALVFAIPLGVIAAIRPNSWIDRIALSVSIIGQAMPSFWFGLILIVLFSVMFPLLPPSGSDTWKHFVMPTIVLGYFAMPAIMRLTRAGMMEVLSADYIRTARAKGLLPGQVLFKHALRNAIMPVVSVSSVQFGYMLNGSVVVESIFAFYGSGYLAWESISRSDLPVVQATILIFSLIFVCLTFAADLINAWVDPRIRVA